MLSRAQITRACAGPFLVQKEYMGNRISNFPKELSLSYSDLTNSSVNII